MSGNLSARIPCTKETREKISDAKRGGDTYDELLCKMIEQYEPEENRQSKINEF
jgi:glucan phosphoethanolaminetransferase (alkaline phosphatase superfamily)